ncbi:MAG: ATP-binding protein [Syntrophaceae bacterium]|nr:ATP-binding protein [Syntrophaceae bacterium]
MKLDFLNREKETIRLQRALQAEGPCFAVVYGRRRIGKSTLLQKIIAENDIYYLADQRNAPLQITGLAEQISRAIPGFSDVTYPSWKSLLFALNARAPDKTAIVLDEFPYLVQQSPELPSIIQKVIDEKPKISIVLCGSSQKMMQGLVLDATAPLYGRAEEIIKLQPLEIGWIRKALHLTAVQSIEAYSVWGGVPRYLELVKKYSNQEQAIKELVFDRNGVLHDEPSRLLVDDLQSMVQVNSLLTLIATGCHKISEIAGRMQLPGTSLARPLARLIDLGYIKRELPHGESLKSTKRTLYKINEPFLLFWFKFVQRNKSLLERGLIDEVYGEFEKKFLLHVSEVWEELARESTARLNIGGVHWKPGSRWWGNGKNGKPMEIDVVAESFDKKSILFGEAKWEENSNSKKLSERLDYCIANFPHTGNRNIVKAIWVRKSKDAHKQGLTICLPEDILACFL